MVICMVRSRGRSPHNALDIDDIFLHVRRPLSHPHGTPHTTQPAHGGELLSPDMVLQSMAQELALNEKVKLSGDPARVALGEELVEHLTQRIMAQVDWNGERCLRGREPEQKQ